MPLGLRVGGKCWPSDEKSPYYLPGLVRPEAQGDQESKIPAELLSDQGYHTHS